MREAAARGKYAPLHRHLLALGAEREWRTSFGEIEAILGLHLPKSARLYRSWRANPCNGVAHGQGIAWHAVGRRTRNVDLEAQTLIFERADDAPPRREAFSISAILPLHDPGPWPRGFAASREQIYDDRRAAVFVDAIKASSHSSPWIRMRVGPWGR